MSDENSPMAHALILENERLQARFDEQSGALLGLTNKLTGWDIQGRINLARSFQLVVPLPERLLNLVEGTRQAPADVDINAAGTWLTFLWHHVTSEHGGVLDIRLQMTVRLADSGLAFEMEIENRSPYVVESAAYPVLGDLTRPTGEDSLQRVALSHTAMSSNSLYPEFRNERGYWGVEYPIQMVPTPTSPFVLVLGADQGLYLGCHDTAAEERVEFTFQLKPGYGIVGQVPAGAEIGGRPVHIECSAVHLPFVQPGETRALAPIVLQPFTGDWHAGADIYRVWRQTWMEPPYVPAWLQDVHAWQQLQMSSWGDTLNISYRDLVEYGKACAENGVSAIQLTGWTLYGQDGRLPIHDIDPRFGTWEELKDAIARIQAMGVKVVLYEKYTCTDTSIDWYRDELHQYASKDVFGNTHGHEGWQYDTPAHLAGINTRPYAWMCMNSAEWHEVALEQVRASLDLDPAGILLDECQWHGKNAFYCFDETHGHRVPAYSFGGDALFEQKLRRLLDERDPDLVLAGEAPYDLQNRHYNLTYHRAEPGHIAGLRYIDPFRPMMNWVYGYDDRESINLCLLYRYIISYEPRHFRGRIDEFPLTLEYGKQVDALRCRYRAYLWDAEFCDTMGARVTVEGRLHAPYSVFRHGELGALAVVIANRSSDAILSRVEFEREPGTLYLVTPEEPERQRTDGAVHIPARCVAVVLAQSSNPTQD